MEEYHAYVQDCNANGIVPISISVYLRPRFVFLTADDEDEDEDPEEPVIEAEEVENPQSLNSGSTGTT
jgi:hypothetical protein